MSTLNSVLKVPIALNLGVKSGLGSALSYLQTCFAGLFGIAALGLVH